MPEPKAVPGALSPDRIGDDDEAASDRRGVAVRSSLMGKARRTPSQGLSSDAPHGVEFFQRHPDDDPAASAPGFEFLIACP
ncbi:MAG TPA: hypothetical protein VLZ05_16380 [Mycobacterium sp.]|nr:hypothetical protein [Mycobacterium sp.]HUH70287.1 hypothetical protein [Mycobacterium sp.]